MITLNGWLLLAVVAFVFLAGCGWGYHNACQDHERVRKSSK